MRRRKPYNLEVTLKQGESVDKLIKRFFKKVKKQEIINEYLQKTSYYRSKSQKKRDKILTNKHLRELEMKKNENKFSKNY